MCLTCGCMLPYERHGDKRNLIVDDIQASTITKVAGGITSQEAVDNLVRTWSEAVEDSVKYTKVKE